jgi:PASTA domain/Glucodextranase, domain B
MLAGRRTLHACAIAALSAGLIGCGTNLKPEPQIHLQIAGPADGATVTVGSVLITGSVSPAGARVLVGGQAVSVTRGAFSWRVSLAPGTNIVDVLAGAPHAQAAMTAVRVYRQVYVSVPDVSGESPGSATQALRGLGLVARIQNIGHFYDFLLPTSPSVCGTSPPAGHSVLPGSTVTVSVSKTC